MTSPFMHFLSKSHAIEVLMDIGENEGKPPAEYFNHERIRFLRFRDLRDLGLLRIEGDQANIFKSKAFLSEEGRRVYEHLVAIDREGVE